MLLDVMVDRSSGAAVIDLEAFRQRKRMREAQGTTPPHEATMLVPVWFCWVPVWTPQMM